MSFPGTTAEHSPLELPVEFTTVVDNFLAERDKRVAEKLKQTGFAPSMIPEMSNLWSMSNFCLMSAELCTDFQQEGIDAECVLNKKAVETEYSLPKFGSIEDVKYHLMVRTLLDGAEVYVDPFWQQFLSNVGLSLEDIENNPELNLAPEERVLFYTRDQVNDLAQWFGVVAREVQDKIKTGVLRSKTDIFTRKPSLTDLFLKGGDSIVPIEYFTIDYLESFAENIWDPANYTSVLIEEVESLARTIN